MSRPSPGHRRSAVNGNGPALLLIFPFVLDTPLFRGFYNYNLGVALLALLIRTPQTAGMSVLVFGIGLGVAVSNLITDVSHAQKRRVDNALTPDFETRLTGSVSHRVSPSGMHASRQTSQSATTARSRPTFWPRMQASAIFDEIKREEMRLFHREISPWEREHLLLNV